MFCAWPAGRLPLRRDSLGRWPIVEASVPGRQRRIQSAGASYETFADAVLVRLAALVPVTRQQDFGIDFYALP